MIYSMNNEKVNLDSSILSYRDNLTRIVNLIKNSLSAVESEILSSSVVDIKAFLQESIDTILRLCDELEGKMTDEDEDWVYDKIDEIRRILDGIVLPEWAPPKIPTKPEVPDDSCSQYGKEQEEDTTCNTYKSYCSGYSLTEDDKNACDYSNCTDYCAGFSVSTGCIASYIVGGECILWYSSTKPSDCDSSYTDRCGEKFGGCEKVNVSTLCSKDYTPDNCGSFSCINIYVVNSGETTTCDQGYSEGDQYCESKYANGGDSGITCKGTYNNTHCSDYYIIDGVPVCKSSYSDGSIYCSKYSEYGHTSCLFYTNEDFDCNNYKQDDTTTICSRYYSDTQECTTAFATNGETTKCQDYSNDSATCSKYQATDDGRICSSYSSDNTSCGLYGVGAFGECVSNSAITCMKSFSDGGVTCSSSYMSNDGGCGAYSGSCSTGYGCTMYSQCTQCHGSKHESNPTCSTHNACPSHTSCAQCVDGGYTPCNQCYGTTFEGCLSVGSGQSCENCHTSVVNCVNVFKD